jgi:hypothetical protein
MDASSSLMNTLFGTLSGDHCMFFYYLMIFMFVRFVLILVSGTIAGAMNGKPASYYLTVVGASLTDFILYYILRILYSMCNKGTAL